jgi:hypothetical protein
MGREAQTINRPEAVWLISGLSREQICTPYTHGGANIFVWVCRVTVRQVGRLRKNVRRSKCVGYRVVLQPMRIYWTWKAISRGVGA